MTDALINFMDIPLPEINDIRKSARKKVEQQHTIEKMVSGMEDLYLKVQSK